MDSDYAPQSTEFLRMHDAFAVMQEQIVRFNEASTVPGVMVSPEVQS